MVLSVMIGGGIGALGRHFLTRYITALSASEFPWGILIVNISGSFLMGLLVAALSHGFELKEELKASLTVGALGAFTTFSTFSLDVILLAERGAFLQALFYLFATLGLSIGALYLGMNLVRGYGG